MTTPPPIALEDRGRAEGDPDARLFSPSAARNREPILHALARYLAPGAEVLEVASGTGEHVTHFAAATPAARFHPGDPDAASRASIAAWTAHLGLANVAPPHAVDVRAEAWFLDPQPRFDVIVSCNMVHIAPLTALDGLMRGAGRLLRPRGVLFLYGPFSRDGVHTAPSNAAFDADLKARDPAWGVRDLDRDAAPLALQAGLALEAVEAMPANNLSVVFRRQP